MYMRRGVNITQGKSIASRELAGARQDVKSAMAPH